MKSAFISLLLLPLMLPLIILLYPIALVITWYECQVHKAIAWVDFEKKNPFKVVE